MSYTTYTLIDDIIYRLHLETRKYGYEIGLIHTKVFITKPEINWSLELDQVIDLVTTGEYKTYIYNLWKIDQN